MLWQMPTTQLPFLAGDEEEMITARIGIKPLSVNQVWQGRRFKTKKYKEYEQLMLLALPHIKHQIPSKARLSLKLSVGVSSKNADLDNVCKPFLDILQKKYGFNDRYVYNIEMTKYNIEKGKEFIQFWIEEA